MRMTADRLRLLHGSSEPLTKMRTLRAGPVTVLLDGIDLRYLRIGDTELVRRVYAAVRDVDWDTVPAEISGLSVTEGDGDFRVEFDAHHATGDIDFRWHGTILGDARGRVEVVFDGRAESPCPYNRIGLCVHHPWRETAGARFRARTPDGEIHGTFPDLIGPQPFENGSYHALFPAFDRLEVDLVTGGRLAFEFEGDLWETEDHRNWTDANFKTYSTPTALGVPPPLEAGQQLRQRIVILPMNVPVHSPSAERRVRLTLGEPIGTRVPSLGLGHDRDYHPLEPRERDLVAALSPAHLRVEVHLDRGDWRDALTAARASAEAIGSGLEVSLHLLEEHVALLDAVASLLVGGPPIERVLVINADSRSGDPAETTRPALVEAVRARLCTKLPGTAFLGGTEIYFTEINRTRPHVDGWDGLCYSISPQIHAFVDVDLVENLDGQAETLRSARVISDGKPVVVSPITMRRRVNFHAAADPRPDMPGELPDSVDVRQSSLFGAAWTAGSLKYVAEGGAASVTYYETTGWRGVLERVDGPELPEKFRSIAGETFPLYHPLADVVEWKDTAVLACESSDELSAVGLAIRDDFGVLRLLVVNLTPVERDVVVGPLHGEFALRRLNEATAPVAASEPSAFRARSENVAVSTELELRLSPFEVVRLDSIQ